MRLHEWQWLPPTRDISMALAAQVMLSSPSLYMGLWGLYICSASISKVANSINEAAPMQKGNVSTEPTSSGKNPQGTVAWCHLKICPTVLVLCSLLLLPVAAFLEFVLIKATGNQTAYLWNTKTTRVKYTQYVFVRSSLPGKPTGGPDIFSSIWVSICCFLSTIFSPKLL